MKKQTAADTLRLLDMQLERAHADRTLWRAIAVAWSVIGVFVVMLITSAVARHVATTALGPLAVIGLVSLAGIGFVWSSLCIVWDVAREQGERAREIEHVRLALVLAGERGISLKKATEVVRTLYAMGRPLDDPMEVTNTD